MGIPSERDCPITQQDDVTKGEKSESDLQSSNFDSGYHSFTCAPIRCRQSDPEMITTTTSLGHDDDFPPPQIPSAYESGMDSRRHRVSSPLTDNEDKTHLVYSDMYTPRTVSPLSPSSDHSTVRDSNSSNCNGTTELAEKIQFLLKLGYSEGQIRTGLYTVGAHASKNDILMAIAEIDTGTLSKTYTEDGANECKAGRSADVELVPRGPSSTAEEDSDVADNLRPIVIDGSNVAMSHGNKEYFSCKGIQIAVQYFLDRGHRDITVFVPIYRKEQTRPDAPIKDQEILRKLEADKILVWTPSRHVSGRRITCYDDRFIVKLAEMTKGVIVSNDNFRDLQNEKPEWKELIEKRLLMYSFVSDRFMPPDDPLGRNGPSLDNFLRIRSESEEKKKPECPYGKKCTYGKKCKYFHPEVPLKSVSEITRRRATPAGVAQEMAEEVIKDSAVCNGRNGASHKNGKMEQAKKHDECVASPSQLQGPRAISPLAMGASGVSNHVPHSVSVNHTPASSIAGITNDLSNMSVSSPNGYPSHYPYPTHHGENNSHSAGASAPTSTPRMNQHLLTPPAFHSQMLDGVGRNGVVSAANPQRVHSHVPPPMNHSSPSAMQSYDRGLIDPQHPSMAPHQFPMTYPSQHCPSQPPHPSYPYYPYHDMMLYHQQMIHHLARMSGMPSRANPPAPSQHPYPPYGYPPQHPMMPPAANLTSPHPGVRQRVYAPGHHSSPPQLLQHGSQHRSTPMDQTPQPGFRDPSNPRHYLFKNLCGLFTPRTVENVLLANPRENDPKKLAKLCLDVD